MTGSDRLATRASVDVRTYTVAELAERLDGRLVGDGAAEISGVNALDAAGANEMTFISDEKHARRWRASGAGAAIVSEGLRVGEAGASGDPRPLIYVADAELAMATLLALFSPSDDAVPAGVHPSAWVDETVSIPATARIGPHVSIGRGCRIGADVTLHAGVRLYEEVEVGDGSVLHANCVVRARCRLGRRVILNQSVSIGCDGFGYRPGPGGAGLVKMTHVGNVEIEDDVEIGAGSCVDRAKFGSTVIGAGTKIDNLVQIAHNCRIGRCCVIAALTGLSGSVTVGDGVRIGGGVGVADHISIGSGVSIGGQTGIIRDVPDGMTVLGLPSAPVRDTLRQWSAIRKLPSLIQRMGRPQPQDQTSALPKVIRPGDTGIVHKVAARVPPWTDAMLQIADESASAAPAAAKQHTLARSVHVAGKGLLLGEDAEVTIEAAPPGHGIVFERVDLNPPVQLPAIASNVAKRARRTTLRVGSASIETIEHCMSALAGLRIDNALIRIDGPELPCGDGSALPFVEPIVEAGLVEQDALRRIFRIREPLLVEEDGAMLAVFPSQEDEFQLIFDLDYGPQSHRIGRQTQTFTSRNGNYREEIARARTYSLKEEAQALWDRGMCRHLTPRDVLVIGDEGPIDNEYRFENEPVRHKILDLLGDLYLVGCEVHGRFVACKSGHELNRLMALKIIRQMEDVHRAEAALRGKELDVRAIQRIMPHRYPMLLVDRVVEIDGDRKAIGVKSVTINEPFFQGHYPGTPIMPGVLIVEAMAQLGGLLMSQKLEHTGKIAVLLSLDKVKLRCPVTPGDQLILEAESVHARARTGTMRCRAFVGPRLAAEAQIRFMMVDAEPD